MKTRLTPIDKIKAAYYYHVRGMDQMLITEVLECNNSARVNEAIKRIELAVGINGGGYKDRQSNYPDCDGGPATGKCHATCKPQLEEKNRGD